MITLTYWRWYQQPYTLVVTADDIGWGSAINSAVVIGGVVDAAGGED